MSEEWIFFNLTYIWHNLQRPIEQATCERRHVGLLNKLIADDLAEISQKRVQVDGKKVHEDKADEVSLAEDLPNLCPHWVVTVLVAGAIFRVGGHAWIDVLGKGDIVLGVGVASCVKEAQKTEHGQNATNRLESAIVLHIMGNYFTEEHAA